MYRAVLPGPGTTRGTRNVTPGSPAGPGMSPLDHLREDRFLGYSAPAGRQIPGLFCTRGTRNVSLRTTRGTRNVSLRTTRGKTDSWLFLHPREDGFLVILAPAGGPGIPRYSGLKTSRKDQNRQNRQNRHFAQSGKNHQNHHLCSPLDHFWDQF